MQAQDPTSTTEQTHTTPNPNQPCPQSATATAPSLQWARSQRAALISACPHMFSAAGLWALSSLLRPPSHLFQNTEFSKTPLPPWPTAWPGSGHPFLHLTRVAPPCPSQRLAAPHSAVTPAPAHGSASGPLRLEAGKRKQLAFAVALRQTPAGRTSCRLGQEPRERAGKGKIRQRNASPHLRKSNDIVCQPLTQRLVMTNAHVK